LTPKNRRSARVGIEQSSPWRIWYTASNLGYERNLWHCTFSL